MKLRRIRAGSPNTRQFMHASSYRGNWWEAQNSEPAYRITKQSPYPSGMLSPFLLIHSLAGPSPDSVVPNVLSFDELLDRYRFLTYDEEHMGFSGFRDPKAQRDASSSVGADAAPSWILVQEFQDSGAPNRDWIELKRIEVKHWWYKNGWEQNSVAFYRLEGSPDRISSDDGEWHIGDDDVHSPEDG